MAYTRTVGSGGGMRFTGEWGAALYEIMQTLRVVAMWLQYEGPRPPICGEGSSWPKGSVEESSGTKYAAAELV